MESQKRTVLCHWGWIVTFMRRSRTTDPCTNLLSDHLVTMHIHKRRQNLKSWICLVKTSESYAECEPRFTNKTDGGVRRLGDG